MTPCARYCEILEAKLSERIPEDPEKRREVCKRMRREGIGTVMDWEYRGANVG